MNDIEKLRGAVEWRHPADQPDGEPIYGWCEAREATSGLGGWWVCWTGLGVDGLGGMHWTRNLSCLTPIGPSAKAIIEFVRERIENDRLTLPSDHYLHPDNHWRRRVVHS